jgi:hypothetical protein
MSDKSYNAGDVEIKLFDLVSLDGKVRQSIITQVVSFDVYESVMLPVMYCEIFMKDSINLIEKFPIIGEEFVEIEFKNPELNSVQFFRFKLASVTNKFTDGQGKTLFYMMKCASEEILENSVTYIQKRYEEGNPYTLVSDIIKTYLKSPKRLNVDATSARGVDKITVSQLTPLQAIDYVRKRAVSKQYKSSSYVFFENRNGFNFTTLEHLISTGKKAIGDKIFFYDSSVGASMAGVEVRNILAYQQLAYNNVADLVQGAALNNRAISINLKTGTTNTIDFDYSKQVGNFAQTDSDNVSKVKTSSFLNKYGNKSGQSTVKSTLIAKSSNNGDTFIEESSGFLQSYVSQLTQNIVRILIYGDAAITAGNIITLKLPNISGATSNPENSKLASGNYLVTKVRHMFVMREKVNYKIALECVKPSYGEADL